MRNLAVWVDGPYSRDALFDPGSALNRDNCLAPYHRLREKLSNFGWCCHTKDFYMDRAERPDAVLFIEMPAPSVNLAKLGWGAGVKKLLVLLECEVIRADNWDRSKHKDFDVIFVWNKALQGTGVYRKINFSNSFPEDILCGLENRTGFCAMIAANKSSPHPLELYSERRKAIRWFESNHPDKFDLYGVGWDRHVFTGPLPMRALNKVPWLPQLACVRYPSYRGMVDQKRPVLQKYRFSVCYENATGIPGYITEKIFDCMFAGCIPVYLGAPDIAAHIPSNCFIDKREFSSYEDLYEYMSSMSENEYRSRQDAIRHYIRGAVNGEFSDCFFADTIAGSLRES